MTKLKELNQDVLTGLIEKLEIPAEQAKQIIGTLEISIARQISRDADMHVVLDEESVSDLTEALRIGAGLSPEKSEKIVGDVVSWINRRRKKAVEFYERGVLEIKKKS